MCNRTRFFKLGCFIDEQPLYDLKKQGLVDWQLMFPKYDFTCTLDVSGSWCNISIRAGVQCDYLKQQSVGK